VRTSDRRTSPGTLVTSRLAVATRGTGFIEITSEVRRFVAECGGADGIVFLFLRHTSASLVIQENADPDVRTDLTRALERLAPTGADWVHDVEGPDDMPAHVKAMINGISLHVPVVAGALGLGTWQGIYLVEHRARPHEREVVMQFLGNCQPASERKRSG
jgi:secondary thiamine-phosphate synthase enzyme